MKKIFTKKNIYNVVFPANNLRNSLKSYFFITIILLAKQMIGRNRNR